MYEGVDIFLIFTSTYNRIFNIFFQVRVIFWHYAHDWLVSSYLSVA